MWWRQERSARSQAIARPTPGDSLDRRRGNSYPTTFRERVSRPLRLPD